MVVDACSWGEWVGGTATWAAVAVAVLVAWAERADRKRAQDELKSVRDRALTQQPSRVFITRSNAESEGLLSLIETTERAGQVPVGEAYVAPQTRWVVNNASQFPVFELGAIVDGKAIPSTRLVLLPGEAWELATDQTTGPLVLMFLADGQRWQATSDKPGQPVLL